MILPRCVLATIFVHPRDTVWHGGICLPVALGPGHCHKTCYWAVDLRSGYYYQKNLKLKQLSLHLLVNTSFEAVTFGLAQAPAYFQQLISMVLQDCSSFTMAYLDDIIIFSKNKQEHLKHIEIIFQKLVAAGLKVKESKCNFFKREIHYLGHLISDKGVHPLPEKLDTIRNMPQQLGSA